MNTMKKQAKSQASFKINPINTPMVRLAGISRKFKTNTSFLQVLRDVDFDIYRGETVAVVGSSGIGKSTLLHIIGTLDRPDEGKIVFEDSDLFSLDDENLAAFRNRKIGFVFQFHHLLQGFSALENVMLPCLLDNQGKKKARMQAQAVLDRVGLGSRLSHRAEDLSGGEQQRVALARALVMKPDMLLADEPTGNLDRNNSRQVHQLLMELNHEFNMTLIVVTHNNELADLMNRKVTLKEGRVLPVNNDFQMAEKESFHVKAGSEVHSKTGIQ